jgi:hypothetical protein
MQTFTIDEILNMGNEDFEKLETTLSEEEKDLIINQVKEYFEQRDEMEEYIHDYVELRNSWLDLNHKMDSEELDAFKVAIFTSYSDGEWEICRRGLEYYFSHHTPEMIRKLNISQWDYRHILKWFQMLINTELYKEPNGTPARIFFQMILEEGTIVRPSKLRAKFEKEIKKASVQLIGLEELLRDTMHVVQ